MDGRSIVAGWRCSRHRPGWRRRLEETAMAQAIAYDQRGTAGLITGRAADVAEECQWRYIYDR